MTEKEQPSTAEAEVLETGPVARVRLAGELDVFSVEGVRPVITSLLAGEPKQVAFDLGGLAFIDSSGIALLLVVANAVERLELRNVSPIVRQVVEKTGLGGILVVTQ
jgi:anti-anti-sigma factor